jgi:Domain of unknown function (DUF4468) with TBP-like fold
MISLNILHTIKLQVLAPALLLVSFTTVGNQIPIDPDTNLAGYKNVVAVPSTSADVLYDRGIEWVNKFYKNPTGVLKKADKAGGEISGKARFKISKTDKKGVVNPNGAVVAYKITLQFKEDKFRYVIDRIRWELPSYYDVSRWTDSTQSNYNKMVFDSYIEQTEVYFNNLTADLEKYVKIGKPVKNDDW